VLLPRVVATYRERGFSRIAELDRKLEDAEMKYLESQRSLRQLQAELATPHDPRWDSLTSELGSYGKALSSRTKKIRPVLSSPTALEAANALRGMHALMTAEDEARVAAILAEDDEDEMNVNSLGMEVADVRIVPTGMFAPVYDSTEREVDIAQQLEQLDVAPPMRTLVFNEKRNTFMLVKDMKNQPKSPFISPSKLSPNNTTQGSSTSKSPSASADPIAEMREKRLAWAKEKQIDAALSTLRQAPLERSSLSPYTKSTSAPLSIRAIVQPVTREDVDELLRLTQHDIPQTLASKEEIQKLFDGVEIPIVSPIAAEVHDVKGQPTQRHVPKALSIAVHAAVRQPSPEQSQREAGASPRVIQIQPKKEKRRGRKNMKDKKSTKPCKKEKREQRKEKEEKKERKSMFGWSVSSKRSKRRK